MEKLTAAILVLPLEPASSVYSPNNSRFRIVAVQPKVRVSIIIELYEAHMGRITQSCMEKLTAAILVPSLSQRVLYIARTIAAFV